MSSVPASLSTAGRARKPADVITLDCTPRTKAWQSLHRLRRFARAEIEPQTALFVLNLAIADLNVVEGGPDDVWETEARGLYKAILGTCTAAMGEGATVADIADFDGYGEDAQVIDLAAERARRPGGAS
jgi:hypothetical protein